MQIKICHIIILLNLLYLQNCNCNKDSGLILELSNKIFIQLKEIIRKIVQEEVLGKNLSYGINEII